jgi:hypothetical protein
MVIGVPIMVLFIPSIAGGQTESANWFLMGPGVAVVATLLIIFFAPTGRIAWGRLCLLNGLASLALPLAGIAYAAMFGHVAMQHVGADEGAKAGLAIGAGLGGAMVAGMFGFVGFFLGAIFLVLAFFILRNAPLSTQTPAPQGTAVIKNDRDPTLRMPGP